MSCDFPKTVRLRSRRQYQRIAQQPTRCVGRLLIVDIRSSKSAFTKLGITASRHYGIAVKRNRFKRVVREAFRLCRQQLPSGFDINVKPRSMARNAKTADVMGELLNLLGTIPSSR